MRNLLFLILLMLFSCGGSKQGINEKDMSDFSIEPENYIAREDSSASSHNIEIESNTTNSIEQKESDPLPVFKFSTIPNDNYDVAKDNDLLLTIVGKGDADISLSWQDNSGNWRTVKNGFKNEDIYTLKYSADFVKNNVGIGEKRFVAEILFDKDREPVMLETSLNIIQSNLVHSIDEITSDTQENKVDIEIESNTVFDDIYFDYKKWKVPSFKYNTNFGITINKVVKALKINPEVNLILTGYTDSVGSVLYNQILAKKRCYSVGQLVLKNFTDAEKKAMEKRIYIDPAGENDPIFKKSENGQAKRRVSLSLSYKGKGIRLSDFNIDKVDRVATIPSQTSSSVAEKYKSGTKAFYAKNFDEALAVFEDIANNNPDNSLADNAKWWIGEIYYIQKDYSTAAKNYKQVFGLGDGNKEAYAQYRIGCCYREMGQLSDALTALKNVKELYPDAKEEWQKAERIINNISQ